jgi:hypothetical protein
MVMVASSSICILFITLLFQLHILLSPFNVPSTTGVMVFAWFSFHAAWLVDLILIFRLLAIFPPKTTPRTQLLTVFALPIALKSARLACLSVAFADFRCGTNVQRAGSVWGCDFNDSGPHRSPYSIVAWSLQVLDNG